MKMVFFSQQWLWRVLSAWMWCHVIFWKCTSVLGGPVNSIFRIGSATWHCIQGDCNPPPPPDGATARGGPWPPLRYASRPLDYLLCLSICLHPSFSGPWTRHPFISFLVFLFVLLLPAFCTTSFLGLQCLINTVCWKLALFPSQDYADICYWHYGFLSYDTVASVLEKHTNSTFRPED